LSAERDALFADRASASPQEQIAVTDRIAAIGRELAAIMTPPPAAALGNQPRLPGFP
jgi:hypothetical protein